MRSLPSVLSNLSDIAGGYEGIILDLFGTIHDGIMPLDGAVEALHRLRDQGISVCLLSNSPRRRKVVRERLEQMGFADDLYCSLVTSGELTFEELTREGSRREYGNRFYHIGPSELADLLNGSDMVSTPTIEKADFILCTGLGENQTLEEIDRTLLQAQRKSQVLFCANPDHAVMIGREHIDCAGAVAERYQQIGGQVLSFGKPFRPAYERALSILQLRPKRVIGIGDGINTDIVGANRAGVDAVLTLTGLQHDRLVDNAKGKVLWNQMDQLCVSDDHYPRFVIPEFRWDR